MTIKSKLWLIAVVVFFAIISMTGVTYFRSSSMLVDFMNKAGVEAAASAAKNVETQLNMVAGIIDSAGVSISHELENFSATEDGIEVLVSSILGKAKSKNLVEIFFGWESNGRASAASGWQRWR